MSVRGVTFDDSISLTKGRREAPGVVRLAF
jgi:hypothetical protein